MDKNFVPFVESLELRQLGFDEPCFGRYDAKGDHKGKIWYEHPNRGQDTIPVGDVLAPTFSQAFCFFREHQDWAIDSWIQPYLSEQPKQYEAFYWTRGEKVSVGLFSSHGEAELACIRKLIEIVKNK